MRLALTVSIMLSMAACKTSAPAGQRADLAERASTPSRPDLRQVAGEYNFTGPDSAIYDRDAAPAQRTALLDVGRDGIVSLEVRFPVAIRASTRMDAGIIAQINPDETTRTETYTVGVSDLFGGNGTDERKIDNTGRIETGDGKSIKIISQTTMHSRPYRWFNKLEWRVYKTVVQTITVQGNQMSYSQESRDRLNNEILTLNFARR